MGRSFQGDNKVFFFVMVAKDLYSYTAITWYWKFHILFTIFYRFYIDVCLVEYLEYR